MKMEKAPFLTTLPLDTKKCKRACLPTAGQKMAAPDIVLA